MISGFVMAHSLRRYPLDARNFGVFALRRSVRLDPPYWLAIWGTLSINALGNLFFASREVELPGPLGVVANMFYLDNILGVKSVVPVGWTLCLEFQFYLVFFLMLWMAKPQLNASTATPDKMTFSRHRALWIFVPAMLFSLGWPLGLFQENIYQGLWFPQWFMFLVGVFAYWGISSYRAAEMWLILFLVLIGATALVYSIDARPTEGVVIGICSFVDPAMVLWVTFFTGVLIYFAGKVGGLATWLGGPVLQYLGRISYSLYLMHGILGTKLMNLLSRFGFDSEAGSLLLLMIGLVSSFIGAHLVYLFVERPCILWGERLRQRLVSPEAAMVNPAYSRVTQ